MVLERILNILKNSVKIENFGRYVEIFHSLLLRFKCNAKISFFTREFLQICLKFTNDQSVEIRLSVLDYFTDIIEFDLNTFIIYHGKVWNQICLRNILETLDDTERNGIS